MEESADLLEHTDSRFKQLLAPHRDLAANWTVDVAVQLIEYAASIGIHLPPSPDDQQILRSPPTSASAPIQSSALTTDPKVDFAHAALILQGSSNIYSKKIDHLYSLVLAAVDSLHNVGNKKGGETSENADGEGNNTAKSSEPVFDIESVDLLAIADEDIEQAESHQISLQAEDDSENESLDDPTRLRPVPPMLTQNVSVSAGSSLEKSKFKIYTATLHPSGALLTEGCPPVDENLEAILRPRHLHLSNSTPEAASLSTPLRPFSPCHDDPLLLPDDDEPCGIMDDCNSNNSAGLDEAPPPFQSQTGDSCDLFSANLQPNRSGTVREPLPREISAPKHNPFELLDPHDPQDAQNRPLRVGRTKYRQPPAKRRRKPLSSLDVTLLDVSTILNGLIGPIPRNASSITYTTTSAAALPLRELLRPRKSRRLAHRSLYDAPDDVDDGLPNAEVGRSAGDGLHGEHSEAERFRLFDDDLDDGVEFGGSTQGLPSDVDDVGLPDEIPTVESAVLDLGNVPEISTVETSGRKTKLGGNLELLASSYAATCEEYLKKTSWMWEQRAVDLKLAKRVSDWSMKIHPLLEKEEQRKEFNIREYGDTVISRLKAQELENDGTASGKMSIILSAKESFEVSRLFLATLQLTNQYNVDIENEGEACCVSDPVLRILAVDGDTAFLTPNGGTKRKRIVDSSPYDKS